MSLVRQQKAKTRSEDGGKPHKQKALSAEAQRILHTLQNCIAQLEIAVSLPGVGRLDNVSSVVNKEAFRVHQILGERLNRDPSGEQADDAKRRARAQLERDFKNSIRNLLRHFRDHPHAIFALRTELGLEVGESEQTLVRGLKKFHEHMTDRLQTSPEEELQMAFSSTKDNVDHDSKLEELVASIKQRDAEILEKTNEIKTLESYLQEDDATAAIVSPGDDKQCQSLIKLSKMKQASMKREIDQLSAELRSLMLENRNRERELQKQNIMVELENEQLLKRFDEEMGERQVDLETCQMESEKEEKELRALETPYADLEVECNRIREKRRLAEEKRRREMRELELKTKAAIIAQAWWRGYSTRRALKSKAKGKKAKKGKTKKNK